MDECLPGPCYKAATNKAAATGGVLYSLLGTCLGFGGSGGGAGGGGGGRPSTSLGGGRQGLILVPIFAHLELTLPLSAQLKLTLSLAQPKLTRGCVPKMLKLSSHGSDVSRTS